MKICWHFIDKDRLVSDSMISLFYTEIGTVFFKVDDLSMMDHLGGIILCKFTTSNELYDVAWTKGLTQEDKWSDAGRHDRPQSCSILNACWEWFFRIKFVAAVLESQIRLTSWSG